MWEVRERRWASTVSRKDARWWEREWRNLILLEAVFSRCTHAIKGSSPWLTMVEVTSREQDCAGDRITLVSCCRFLTSWGVFMTCLFLLGDNGISYCCSISDEANILRKMLFVCSSSLTHCWNTMSTRFFILTHSPLFFLRSDQQTLDKHTSPQVLLVSPVLRTVCSGVQVRPPGSAKDDDGHKDRPKPWDLKERDCKWKSMCKECCYRTMVERMGWEEDQELLHSKPKSRGDSLLTHRMEEKDKRRSNRQQIDDKKNKQTIQAST